MQDTTKQISKTDNLLIPQRKETNRMTCSPAVDYKHQINFCYPISLNALRTKKWYASARQLTDYATRKHICF